MSVFPGTGGCEKCDCNGYLSREDGIYDAGSPSMAPGWAILPSHKCQWCGHKEKVHTVYIPPPAIYGAVATYFIGADLQVASTVAATSQEEAEARLHRYCTETMEGSDPIIRIQGSGKYLALARSADGKRLGWASDYMRGAAERLAAKNCGDRKHSWVYSIHAKDGDRHTHPSGEPYCK
jgi:hypothetical protein